MPKKYFAGGLALVLICNGLLLAGPTSKLSDGLEPFLSLVDGSASRFTVTADVQFTADGKPQQATVILSRTDEQTFSLEVRHEKYPLILIRDAGKTSLVLPAHRVQFVGEGAVSGDDVLAPEGILDRLIDDRCAASNYVTVLAHTNGFFAARALTNLAGLSSNDGGDTWTSKKLGDAKITFVNPQGVTVEQRGNTARATLVNQPAAIPQIPAGLATVTVKRDELERLIVRGVRRALQVAAPGSSLTDPSRTNRVIPHGEIRWIGDQRVVLLSGTPEQIGAAHGALLKDEARRCADSALYMVGLGSTLATGKWFPDELRIAYAQLEKHIPADHKAETDALADAAGISREEGRLANVFPELFHCSGFALFGKATIDGKLYHGRVLDYMTKIGLQDTATTFIIAPDSKIPFTSIGYAGFVGSVSGMNARQISLGEMGGRGEGQWDGVPMATLMRRGLEECATLGEVKTLWSTNPRTCEYFYVFADGKGPDAVACSATPGKCEFLRPGQSHELLGPGIEDAVVLSAGSRLTELRQRVTEGYGKFDATKAMALMCRPVAMDSNLHDVLFVPQDGVFYVANADHRSPAADRPYTKYDLNELLRSMRKDGASK